MATSRAGEDEYAIDEFMFLQTEVDLRDLLEAAISRNDEGQDSDTNLDSPLTSLTTTPDTSVIVTTKELPFIHSPPHMPNIPEEGTSEGRPPSSGRVAYKKRSSKVRKNKKKAIKKVKAEAKQKLTDTQLRESIATTFIGNADSLQTGYDASTFRAAATGFVGVGCESLKTRIKVESIGTKHKTQNFRTIPWNRRTKPLAILDRCKRVIAVLVPPPQQDETWQDSMGQAAECAEETRSNLPKGNKPTCRRENFESLTFGILQGQGQPKLMRLKEGGPTVQKILNHKAFKRMARFQSGCFLAWAPDLYSHYAEHLQALLDKDSELTLNFSKCVFACATLNLGPRTVCFRHKDHANLPYGWCAVTAFGDFDHTRGGHFILWELGLVLEFPPGATLLLPSACISHSNININKGEKRYSFTQYTAGSIFRWVDHGFQLEKVFWSSLNCDEKVAEEAKMDTRVSSGLALLHVF